MTLRREKIPRSRMRERRFIYSALNGLKITDITFTQIDQIKENTYAQGGVLVNEYDAIEQVSRLGGQTSSSGYLLGTLVASDGSISLDSAQNLVMTPNTPRANYKIERIGLIASSLDTTATFKIVLYSEIDSAEVPLFSEVFSPRGTSDAWSFNVGVTIPEGSVLDVKITSDKAGTPTMNIGVLYGRVR